MKFIDVTARFYPDGVIVPLQINWDDGSKYKIDRILVVKKACSLKSGGVGLRYTCKICGKIRNIYLDDNKWFV